jgi:hypothetical protein
MAQGTTRCKFVCNGVEKTVNGWRNTDGTKDNQFLYRAKFSIVSDGSEENKQFFKWTPSGNLEVGIYTEDRFMPGQEYYIDITPAN